MRTVVVAGGSGVVGSRLLAELLARPDVERVVAVGRRPLALQHAKLESRVVDLRDAAAIAGVLPDGADAAFCALGTTMRQAGSKAAFRAVDLDAVVALASAARTRGVGHFLLVSSLGADARSAGFYLRTKGEAEAGVVRHGPPEVTIVRPSFIDDEGTRRDRRIGERLALPVARAVFGLVGRTSRWAPVTATTIARSLVRLAFDAFDAPMRIVESDQLHVLGA